MGYLIAVLAVLVGIAGLAAGQADDSPGLGGLALVVAAVGVTYGIRLARRRRGP